MTAAIAVTGMVAAASWDDDVVTPRTAAVRRTTTTAPAKVLAIVLDNTTTTAAPSDAVVTTTTVSTSAARPGKIWGYSFPSRADETTTIRLARAGATVAEKQTDADGLFDFGNLAPGTYRLTRTSHSSYCPTTTTAGSQPTCTAASSLEQGPEVQLAAGQDSRVDFF